MGSVGSEGRAEYLRVAIMVEWVANMGSICTMVNAGSFIVSDIEQATVVTHRPACGSNYNLQYGEHG